MFKIFPVCFKYFLTGRNIAAVALCLFISMITWNSASADKQLKNTILMTDYQTQPMDSFTILHTSDFHGRYDPIYVTSGNTTAQTGDAGKNYQEFNHSGMVGGMAYLATAIERIKKENGKEKVMLINSGDSFSDDLLGNITKGNAMIRLMNELGFQLMALGNHDFDYGVEQTRKLQELAEFPMRGANVLDSTTGEPFLGDPVVWMQMGDIRVGLLALGYHNTSLTGSPENVRGLKFTSGIEAAQSYIPKIRQQADVVIVLSHSGTKVDEEIARKVSGIDIIIGGHSHDKIDPPMKIKNTWMVQALSDGTMLGELKIIWQEGKIKDVQSDMHVLWNDSLKPDARISQLIEGIRAPYLQQLEEEITEITEPIGRQYKSESPFDHLAGELLRKETGAEIAMLPGVGYGVTLYPGPLTREALYRLMPHPSKLVTLMLTGTQISAILEQSATNNKPDDVLEGVGGLIQTSGLSWHINYDHPRGKRVSDIKVGQQPLNKNQIYSVVTHSGMLSGIHKYDTFKEGTEVVKHETEVSKILEKQLRLLKKVAAPKMGHIVLEAVQGK